MRIRPLSAFTALIVGTLAGLGATHVAASGQQAATSYYTQAQADQGHMLFNNYCAECHRPDLTGAAGPALKGQAFLQRWAGQPISDLYGFEHSEMPATNPGSLSDDKLLPITAYILSKNGFPAGEASLDKGSLSQVLPKP